MHTLLGLYPHLLSFFIQAARVCFWLALMTAIFAPLEHFFAVRPEKFFRPAGLPTAVGTSLIV
ncbi:MAG: hypothetical protein WDN04_19760 [Rhodospirillales bacterium]